ncbi:hypothetical protein L226DRAFT_509944 [Lentinus tigrinus ALCF2SS1-7]|uniref:Uncharacterized protein n=1 Tax=Lentinus tigrinus ALCF2SS1-6 TaxID=1328759 RepID=A0A5C2RR13_9APHY|nr:hypothetical protein L227DRAFT_535812 [Lentinus tigrinus ALCF2SS1-6]RPD73669.1 hypothetical protein L226DRAFT_509944 [Lentinus tigrinus ALCF2SS1-7]
MASMVAVPHRPHIQAAANASGGNAITIASRMVSRVQGWTEDIHLKAAATRRCINPSCANILDSAWPSKRCAPCREAAMREKVNVPCSSCFVTPLSVTRREARSGAQFICSPCWQRMKARIPVPVSTQTARPITQGMLPPLPQASQPPAPPSAPMSWGPPPPAPVAAPQHAADILELIKKFVHPDHRHVLERRDEDTPLTPIKPVPPPSALLYDEARRRVQSVMPHYGVHGEVLATVPQKRRAVPSVMASVPNHTARPPPAAIQPIKKASAPLFLSKLDKTTAEAAREVSETCAVASPRPGAAKSGELDAPPSPVRKKRKRALGPVPPAALVERVCAAPGCSRTIPPRFQGALCVQCGFAQWQSQFRARFTSFRSEIKDKENKAPAPTMEPAAATVVEASSASVVGDADEVGAVAASSRKLDVAGPKVDNIPPPSQSSSEPHPHTVEMLPEQTCLPASRHPDAMDVDSESSDDEPLSARGRQPSAMVVDSLTSDEEPLSALMAHNDDVTSDEEPLSAMLHGYASSDEEPLAKAVSACSSASPQKLSATHAASGTSSSTYAPLRIVIPPLPQLAPPRIRRVRLILGPRPPTPDSSSSSRESSPEPSSGTLYSSRRRTSSAIDEGWLALGWDSEESELTPLEESTDEGESEIDPAESEDDAPAPAAASAPASNTTPTSSPSKRERKPGSPKDATGKKHRGQCATAQCVNLLSPDWKWKHCDTCRLRTRILRKQQRRAAAAQAIQEAEEFELPADGDLTGWHKCSRRSCKRMMPERYQYKRCVRCRAIARRHKAKGSYGLEDLPDDEALLFAATGMHDGQLTAVGAGGAFEVEDTSGSAIAKNTGAETLEDLPPYQHFAALLGTLRQRFDDFKAAQMRYVQLKALQGAERKPMVFGFDGEYSIVADPSGGSVDAIVNTVIRNLSIALNLVFTLVDVRSGPEDCIIAALRCRYKPRIPALRTKRKTEPEPKVEKDGPPPPEPKKSAAVEVTMTGDLDIGVAWDRRHKYFPGQRIMVRFRLLG